MDLELELELNWNSPRTRNNEALLSRGFELYLVTCCVYKHNTSVVCINMSAFKTVGSSVVRQNVNTEAGLFNSFNSTRITLMRNLENVISVEARL